MAVTKTHPIKSTLKAAIDYICNPAKTDGKLLVSTYGCTAETADIEFAWTRRHSIDKGTNLGRHLIQAFEPGEVSPEKAHEIGMQLAKEILGGKYEFVLTTHIDKDHVHNHLIFNAVSFADHRHYHSNKRSYNGPIEQSAGAAEQLEALYTRFNIDHPEDFRGHGMSVSDIVALKVAGEVSCYYVDAFGFVELQDFMKPENYLKNAEMAIYDTIEDADGKQKRVLNKKETTLAQQKQQAIKDAFQDWVWKDPRRREALVTKYNELFNSTRPREYDGSHIRFGGMNPDITLREHQRNAIAHVLYGGNTLLAHEVGAGKTFEMAASAMESKRLGLSQKSIFVVPNHLTLQWANEFLHLYPSAKLLVATKKDFETANRKKFCARIATGDYDAVIIGHSQFEKIPLSAERQERQLQEQIDEIEGAIAELKYQRGENFTIKQMEKTRKSLEARLDRIIIIILIAFPPLTKDKP